MIAHNLCPWAGGTVGGQGFSCHPLLEEPLLGLSRPWSPVFVLDWKWKEDGALGGRSEDLQGRSMVSWHPPPLPPAVVPKSEYSLAPDQWQSRWELGSVAGDRVSMGMTMRPQQCGKNRKDGQATGLEMSPRRAQRGLGVKPAFQARRFAKLRGHNTDQQW